MSIPTQQKTLFQRFFPRKKTFIALILVACIVVLTVSLYALRVTRIEVVGADVVTGIRHYASYPLPLLSVAKMEKDVALVNPHLTDISISKKYPQTIRIQAKELQQVATVKLADGYANIAENGVILAKSRTLSDSKLPVITFYQPIYYNQLVVGDTMSFEEIHTAVSMLEAVEEVGDAISTIDIADADMIVLQTDTYSVVASSEVDSQMQQTRYAYTYAEFKRRGKVVTSLDVRFERPIITFKK